MLLFWPISEGYELRLAILSACGLLDRKLEFLSPKFKNILAELPSDQESSDKFSIQWKNDAVVTLHEGEPVPVVPHTNHSFFLYFAGLSGPIIEFFHTEGGGDRLMGAVMGHYPDQAFSEVMFSHYGFHTSLPIDGNEYLRWMNWDASTLAAIVRGLIRRDSNTLNFWTNYGSIGLPYLYPDGDEVLSEKFAVWCDFHKRYGFEVCVNGATITAIDDLTLILFSDQSNLPPYLNSVIGDKSQVDDNSYAYIPDNSRHPLVGEAFVQARRYDLVAAENLRSLALQLSPMPVDRMALKYASCVKTIAYLWMVFHEEAHIHLGHIDPVPIDVDYDLASRVNDKRRLSETGKRSLFRHTGKNSPENEDTRLQTEAVLSQLMELQADTEGFMELLALISQSHIKDNLDTDVATSRYLVTCVLFDATAIDLFFLSATGEAPDARYASHPPVETRFICLMTSFFRVLNGKDPAVYAPTLNGDLGSRLELGDPFFEQILLHRDELIERLSNTIFHLEEKIQGNAVYKSSMESLIHDIEYLSDSDDPPTVARGRVRTFGAKWLLSLREGMTDETAKWFGELKMKTSLYLSTVSMMQDAYQKTLFRL